MSLRFRSTFFLILGFLILWFLYLEKEILAPFILGGIFAYIVNPIVNFFSDKIKFPRTFTIVCIYLLIVGVFIYGGVFLTKRVISESDEMRMFINNVGNTTKEQVQSLPDWLSPAVQDMLTWFQKSKLFSPEYLILLFPKAISRLVSFVIFLFSGFYFLKEGRNMFDKLLLLVPSLYKIEVEILFRRINSVLGAYLRGQMFLVFFVSSVLFIALSILGVRFALILAIFSGFAEIIPFIGPTIAIAVASFLVLITGGVSNFPLDPLTAALVVAAIYFVVRQFQDYFINPYVIGRITKLHPLIILFSVLSGEHLAGILGVILAVPTAATIRILLEFSLDKIYEQEPVRKKS